MTHKTLSKILGCALLLYGSSAMAFTLITLPEQLLPSNSVTDSFTLDTQVQPIAGTIRTQIFSHLRPRKSQRALQFGSVMVAANDYSNSSSDVTYLAAAGGVTGGGNADTESLWVSGSNDWLENTFSRTAFHGTTQNVIVGLDFARSNRFVFGVSGGYEASNFTTDFNNGDERTQGFNFNPYFAWLLSDTWSWDLIGGYGGFNTDQSRVITASPLTATLTATSKYSSKRSFASSNVTGISVLGNVKLTGSLGYLWSKRENEAYTDGIFGTVDESEQTSKQWNLLGEIAFGAGNSEGFFGARYEDIMDYHDVVLTSGAGEQPANDPTSFLLTAGWRHYGRDLSANFVLNTRLGQEQVRGYGFSLLLRFEL